MGHNPVHGVQLLELACVVPRSQSSPERRNDGGIIIEIDWIDCFTSSGVFIPDAARMMFAIQGQDHMMPKYLLIRA